uniref:Uncharacterized protein n=1 Tax=Branchiostoma floridae TaxID=7739 RepID=C3YIQ8_BRAFL|eukprot:XP_002603771.1 hypothetical protein BRAFLDRAFT_124661 [Branchiostoma floridae]
MPADLSNTAASELWSLTFALTKLVCGLLRSDKMARKVSTGTMTDFSDDDDVVFFPSFSACAGCGDEIKSGQALLALDKQWHLWCFKCTQCGCMLAGEYMGKEGRPYCERDYQQLFGVKCAGCLTYITGKVLQLSVEAVLQDDGSFSEAGEKHYHPHCAKCAKCGLMFGEGEEMYLQDNQIWHPDCSKAAHANGVKDQQIAEKLGNKSPPYRAKYPKSSPRCPQYILQTPPKSPLKLRRQVPTAPMLKQKNSPAPKNRMYMGSYLNKPQGMQRASGDPKDPKQKHFHTPESAFSYRYRPRVIERDESEDKKKTAKLDDDIVQATRYPSGFRPQPDFPSRIERDDWPGPPSPAATAVKARSTEVSREDIIRSMRMPAGSPSVGSRGDSCSPPTSPFREASSPWLSSPVPYEPAPLSQGFIASLQRFPSGKSPTETDDVFWPPQEAEDEEDVFLKNVIKQQRFPSATGPEDSEYENSYSMGRKTLGSVYSPSTSVGRLRRSTSPLEDLDRRREQEHKKVVEECQSGLGKMILKDMKPADIGDMDPRSASRVPAADHEPPFKPRYDSPVDASPSRTYVSPMEENADMSPRQPNYAPPGGYLEAQKKASTLPSASRPGMYSSSPVRSREVSGSDLGSLQRSKGQSLPDMGPPKVNSGTVRVQSPVLHKGTGTPDSGDRTHRRCHRKVGSQGWQAALGRSCPKQCSCPGNSLDCGNRGLRAVPKGIPRNTERIQLLNNQISTIEKGAFQDLVSLERLRLNGNVLKSLPDLLFSNMPRIYRLCCRSQWVQPPTSGYTDYQGNQRTALNQQINRNSNSNAPPLEPALWTVLCDEDVRILENRKICLRICIEQHPKSILSLTWKTEENEDTALPLLLVDTTGCDLWEMDVPSDQSKGNKGEADLTRTHVERLIQSGVCQEDIAVISPYNLQVELLRQHLSCKYPRLEIKSVDGFQGREKEAVVISLVRSNENREVGFLAEDRRINVAITRARRHLAIICDSETVSHHKFLSSLMDYMSTHGEVRSAHQYSNDSEVTVSADYSNVPVNVHRKQAPKETSGSTQTKGADTCTTEKDDVTAEVKQEPQPSEDVGPLEKKEESDESKTGTLLQNQQAVDGTQKANNPTIEQDGSQQISESVGGTKPKRKRNRNRNKNKFSQENIPNDNTEVNQKQTITTEKEQTETLASNFATCEHCGKELPKPNLELHTMHCRRVAELKGKLQAANAPREKVQAPPKQASSRQENKRRPKSGKKKQGGRNLDEKEDGNDDFDAMLARVVKEDHSCHYERCKNSVATVGQFCTYCRKLYCLSHHMPEVHGCGEDAHMEARARLSKVIMNIEYNTVQGFFQKKIARGSTAINPYHPVGEIRFSLPECAF